MPRVSVRNSVRKPTSPRAGTRYSMRAHPLPWLTICCRRPFRSASICVTTPTYSSGTSIATRSTGSARRPSTSFVSTSGLPTVSSKPSRRISSTRIASWSSPRPCTSQASGREVGRTRSETFPTSSASSRSRIWLAVSRVPSSTGERARVDPDRDRQARLVDGRDRKRPRVVGVGDGLADRHLCEPGQSDDLARPGLLRRDAFERLRHVELGRTRVHDRPVGAAPGDRRALAEHAVADPEQREAAQVRARVEIRDERLQRVRRVIARRGDRLEQRVEEGRQVLRKLVRVKPGATRTRVGEDDRELDLRLVGVEVEEELVDLVHDLRGPRIRPVDLVDDEHDRELQLERLPQHEPRLGKRPFRGVDEKEHAVDHRQAPLDLAAEVGMPWRVDDVDLRLPEPYRRVLGEDRDALLTLEVHRVEHALGDVLVLAERAGLPEHRVDERRLAVIDVRDNRDVPEIVSRFHHLSHMVGHPFERRSERCRDPTSSPWRMSTIVDDRAGAAGSASGDEARTCRALEVRSARRGRAEARRRSSGPSRTASLPVRRSESRRSPPPSPRSRPPCGR